MFKYMGFVRSRVNAIPIGSWFGICLLQGAILKIRLHCERPGERFPICDITWQFVPGLPPSPLRVPYCNLLLFLLSIMGHEFIFSFIDNHTEWCIVFILFVSTLILNCDYLIQINESTKVRKNRFALRTVSAPDKRFTSKEFSINWFYRNHVTQIH